MLALGIILLLIAAAVGVGVATTGTSQNVVFNSAVGDVTTRPVWIFCAGALAMLLALLGLWLIRRGTRRRVERRREINRLRKVEQEHVSGPVPTTTATRPDDEPDRQLVRDPGDPAYRAVAEPTAGEPISPPGDEPGVHREP